MSHRYLEIRLFNICDCPCESNGVNRQRFGASKISEKTIELMSSWRDETNSNYNLSWKAWESWLATRGVYLFATDFLAEKFEVGLKYHLLSGYNSAFSSALLPVDGFQVGQHPFIS